jgi:RimJ/RimL family protein N-acetyltransferase
MENKLGKISKLKISNIVLKNISEKDYRFLYCLLKERDQLANISHRKMPSYKEHISFIESKPYSKWHVIFQNNKKVGSIYLSKQDEIGLFLKKDLQSKGIGSISLGILIKNNPRPRYLANISPKNEKSIKFFKKNKFNLIQHTYEFNISFGK